MTSPAYVDLTRADSGARAIRLPRITVWRVALVAIIAAGLYASWLRFARGLGATTALSDQMPWGLWVGFDVLCGVGLAAGGFTITAAVHLFGIKHLKPIVRPAILTAFLGYMLVSLGLIYDLGKPWNIWHPLVMWNPHSVMFEVAWCVMLYSTVMALEFSPVIFERFGLAGPLKVVRKLTVPLVLAGVLLSTMHQSSLGTVFLIFPTKMHALWYSSALPIFFFVSAIAVGLSMVIFESYLSFRFLGHRLKEDVLRSLGRGSVVVLAVYLVMRIFDLLYRGVFPLVFDGSMEAWLLIAELGIGAALPIVLFANTRVRESRHGLFIAAAAVVIGFVLARLNVGLTAFEASSGVTYIPSWVEISVSAMIVAIGFVVFGLAAKHLPIFSEHGGRRSG